MANILIVDDQDWVVDLCREGLEGHGHEISMTDDVETVRKSALSFKPDIVILNLYLKHGFFVWDVLDDIKIQDPNLPVLIVTAYDNFLFEPHLSKANGHLVKSHTAAAGLAQKVSALLYRTSNV